MQDKYNKTQFIQNQMHLYFSESTESLTTKPEPFSSTTHYSSTSDGAGLVEELKRCKESLTTSPRSSDSGDSMVVDVLGEGKLVLI